MTTYILDTETTGLNDPHMTEAAYSIIDINNEGRVVVLQPPRSKRFNPLKPISLGAMATSHICDIDIANAPPHTDFRLPTKVEYLIGHNIDFDMQVLKNAGVTHTPKLICTKAMSNYLLPTLDSHTLVALLYYFHPNVARKQAKEAHAAEFDIYFTQLVLDSLIALAIQKGHTITDMASLYQFSELARIPTHFSFGKYKGKAIAEVAATTDGAGYLSWLMKQDGIDAYLTQACQQALDANGE